jgi:small subunit ribosomal protein S8
LAKEERVDALIQNSRTKDRLHQGVQNMTMTDPVSDLLTRIRNGAAAKHETVDVPSSRLKLEIVRILKEEGYIDDFLTVAGNNLQFIRIKLRYSPGKRPVISTLERVSRPGCRVYAGKAELPEILGGLGICIVSTSHGLMTSKQARQKGLGGEVLCAIS